MSSYQRLTGATDTYMTISALPTSLQRFVCNSVAIAQKNDHLESFLKWFKSQKPQLNLTKLAESGKPSTSGKKGSHRNVSTKKGTKYIQDILSQAEESSFKTREPMQKPILHLLQHLHNHPQHLISHLGPLSKHLW